MTEDKPVPNVTPEILSPVELRLAALLAAGCSIDQTAAALNWNRTAVFTHCDAMCRKVGADDYPTLIRWAKRYDVGRW